MNLSSLFTAGLRAGLLLVLLFAQHTIFSQTIIWQEDFEDLANGTTVDNGATAWSLSVPAADALQAAGGTVFSVQNGLFSAIDLHDGGDTQLSTDTRWNSGPINIEGLNNVFVVVNAGSETTAGFENQDFIQFFFTVDGVEQPFDLDGVDNTAFQGPDFTGFQNPDGVVDGVVIGQFFTVSSVSDCFDGGLTGATTLEISIRFSNSTANEFYTLDEVTVFSDEDRPNPADFDFVAAQDGDWNVATTWSPNGIPTATDEVLIPCGLNVSLDSDQSVERLVVDAGSALIFGATNPTLTVSNGGSLSVLQNGSLIDGGPIGGGAGDFAGTIAFDGDVTLINDGVILIENISLNNANTDLILQGSGSTETENINFTSTNQTFTNQGELIVGTMVNTVAASTFTNDANACFTFNGTDLNAANQLVVNANAANNTFCYSAAGNQEIYEPAASYFNLTVDNSGTKDLNAFAGDLDVDNNLLIGDAAVLDAGAAAQTNITLGGDLLETSTAAIPLVTQAASVTLDGSGNQVLQSTNGTDVIAFNNLVINKPSGEVNLNSTIDVNGQATFTAGIINSSTGNELIFNDNGTTSGANANSFVDGPVIKIGDDAFTFPIGDQGVFARLAISAPAVATASYTAEYFADPFSDLSVNGITEVSQLEYWELSGNDNVTVELFYESASGSGISDFANPDLVVARFDGADWVSVTGTPVVPSSPSGSVISDVQTVFGQFTFGSANGNNTLNNSPGGVGGDLNLWLRADQDVVNNAGLITWGDQSGQGNDATQTGGTTVTGATSVNGNNVITASDLDRNFSAGTISGQTIIYAGFANAAVPPNPQFSGYLGFNGDLGVRTNTTNTASVFRNGATSNADDWSSGGAYFLNGLSVTNTVDDVDQFHIGVAERGSAMAPITNEFFVGGYFAGRAFSEEIAFGDVIVFGDALTATERQMVTSYLAVKYGITIDQSTPTDYVAGDGSTLIWDAIANSSFGNDIAAIGRDDVSDLSQLSSRSINSGSIVTIANGNLSSPTTFAQNSSFLAWSHDGGSTLEQSSDLMEPVISRLGREWKIDETGSVGTTGISFDLNSLTVSGTSAGDFILLVDRDGNGDFTDAGVVDAFRASSFASGVVTFENIDFEDGDVFTLGTSIAAPGGVSDNLVLWLRADDEVFTSGSVLASDGQMVETWADFSGSGNDGTGVGHEPIFRNNIADNINGNPVLEFVVGIANDYVETSGSALIGDNNAYTKFSVAEFDQTGTSIENNLISSGGSGTLAFWLGGGANQLNLNHEGNILTSTSPLSVDIPFLLTGRYGQPAGASNVVAVNSLENTNTVSRNFTDSGPTNIGAFQTGTGGFDGTMGESIIYNASVSDVEIQRVESYLAFKYGITLDQTSSTNYLSSTASVLWNAAANSVYSNDIAGIGRDNGSAIVQSQSRSVNSDGAVTISQTGAIADQNFLFWGNDDAAFNLTTSNTGGQTNRFTRIWRVQETGDLGSVDIAFDLTTLGLENTPSINTNVVLLIDNVADFSSPTTVNGVSSVDGSGNTVITFTGVDLANAEFFTIGGALVQNEAPGDIAIDLSLWLRADGTDEVLNGASQALAGQAVNTWADAFNSNDATATGGNEPTFQTNQINGNAALDFDGTDDFLQNVTNGFATQEYFVVLAPDAVINQGTAGEYVVGFDIANGANTDDGFILGAFTGVIDDEILSHVVENTGNYVQSQNSSVASFAAEPILFGAHNNELSPATTQVITANASTVEEIELGTFSNFSGPYSVGNNPQTAGSNFDGRIAEVISYDGVLSALDRRHVESYLAIKYGLTIDVSSSGYTTQEGVIYDATTTYENDITGIGVNTSQGLDQQSSQSINSNSILGISNALDLDDGEYLVLGDDGLGTDITTTPIDDVVGNVSNRMTRVWRIQETGSVGTVDFNVSIPTATDDVVSLVYHPFDPSFPATSSRLEFDMTGTAPDFSVSVDLPGSGFITFANATSVALPVELVFFEAAQQDNEVALRWQTASESNNDFFEVQRSVDGYTFEVLGTIGGNGTTSQPTRYQFIDDQPIFGRAFYRLRQVDFDGQFEFSPIRLVNFERTDLGFEVSVFPNPSSRETVNISLISGNIGDDVQIDVVSLLGLVLDSRRITLDNVSSTISLVNLDLSTGTYLVRVRQGDQQRTKRLVIE